MAGNSELPTVLRLVDSWQPIRGRSVDLISLARKLKILYGQKAVFGTIPSIPISIPRAKFGIELTSHSNSTLGIGAATPIPTQQNWGDSTGIPISLFPPSFLLKKTTSDI